MNFEKKLAELEKIVEVLSQGELSLEESLKSFEKGIQLFKECSKELNQSENKVQKLVEAGGDIQSQDFKPES